MGDISLAIGIGGAAGQGIATPGDILARICVRRGLHLKTYNAYQSIVRGGHIFLTLRTSTRPLLTTGDRLDVLVALNQDAIDRHLSLMRPGSAVLFNADKIVPAQAGLGVQLCPFSVKELAPNAKGDLVQNTIGLGAVLSLLGVEFASLEEILTLQFQKKGQAAIDENVGGAAAGVRFYCAYPMSPSTGVLHWMARHARQLGIMVRQVEDELGVINMAIGAAHTGVRAMCATSGGGFALMTEALGAAAMMEIPVVCIEVQRAGPATGVPTKTEQGDLWQVLGAGQGDYPRIVVAPTCVEECFHVVPELFNLVDRFQCPGIVLADLLESEGFSSLDPAELDFNVPINRGEVIGLNGANGPAANGVYRRYEITPDGISPRAIPGTEGYAHVVATDEHDEDGVLISDEFTNPLKRQAMHEKRMRKMEGVLERLASPELFGPPDAEVTLIGWGSTRGVIREAMQQLAAQGITANNLQVKWLVPLHAEAITEIVGQARKTIIVENNYS